MKKVYYIHGFNSGIKPNKINELSKILNENIIGLEFDSSISMTKNLQKLIKCIDEKDENILIGTSLGGYYSNVLSLYLNCKSIITNPSLKPFYTLNRYIGTNINFVSNIEYDFTNEILNSYNIEFPINKSSLILLSENDELLNSRQTFETYRDIVTVVMFEGGEHRFEFYNDSKKIINNFINE